MYILVGSFSENRCCSSITFNMQKYILIIISLFLCHCSWGQEDYQLSNFNVIENALIAGQGTYTQGLDIQFRYSPDTLNGKEHMFSIDIVSKEYSIGKQTQPFTFTCNDSITYLIDSLSIDSVLSLDTIVHIYVPYRSLDIEEGNHNVTISIFAKGKTLPIYKRRHRIDQIKIYDLFIDLHEASIIPDSNSNPLGLNYNPPDPKWLVKIGVDQTLHGAVTRNSYKPKPKSFNTSITNYDTVSVCMYDSDITVSNFIGCYTLEHGSNNFTKNYSYKKIGPKVEKAKFDVKKIERIPASSDFNIIENYSHKNIKGVKVNFNYSLPIHYERRNIRIQIFDENQAFFENLIELDGNRSQKNSRIIGNYTYFISYYNLQKSKQIKLNLLGNDKTIQQYQTDALVIEKTIDGLSLEQTIGHTYKGISGILYKVDFQIQQFPNGAELKLEFPSLNKKVQEKLLYWNESQPNKIQKGSHHELEAIEKQTILIFLPYFVAPKYIKLAPRLTIEAIDIPPITLANFESEAYTCPLGLNDIQIQPTSNKKHNFTGLSGQLFSFNTLVPSYYHSKGSFQIQILEDGQAIEKGFFINQDVKESKQQPIRTQKNIDVFIPYRFMAKSATYEISLQAKNNTFAISELKKEQYANTNSPVKSIGLYLHRLSSKDWDEIVYKIGIRNDRNINSTYEHLGFKILLEETVDGNYKPDIPKAIHFDIAPDDEIVIWIKEKNMRDDEAIRLQTSLKEIQDEGDVLTIKNQGALKQVIFKLIASKDVGRF
jgi:hypothetical protein